MTQRSPPFDSEQVRLFDLSLDAFCVAGLDGHVRLANRAFAHTLGYTQEELLSRPFMDNVHPDDVESATAVLAELAAGNDIVGFECRQICADGSVRWFEWSTSTVPEEGVVYAVGRDVTERRLERAELDALRRVATLVAEGVQPQDLFAVVAEEVARVVAVPLVSVARYELDGTATECASFSPGGRLFAVGRRWSLDGTNVLALVQASGEAARIDDHSGLDGEIADAVRRSGIRSTVGIPIVVAGRLWGAMVVSGPEPVILPVETEVRLADFTELLATAIANTESREALQQLADEQAALRRVATLVARGVRPAEIFSAVSEEVGRLFGTEIAAVGRFDSEGSAIAHVRTGEIEELVELDDFPAFTEVRRTGRSARADAGSWASARGPAGERLRSLGLRSMLASPIVVEGRLWGTMLVASVDESLPRDAEKRLEKFTDIVATAIANAESRAELEASRARIVTTADATRRRIERDLHDGAQQRLLSLALELRAAQMALPAEMTTHRAELSNVAGGLTEVLDGLREIALGIHPAILAEGGLGSALKTLAQRSPIPVRLAVKADGRLPEDIEVAVYYIVSEALTNAAKHSRASNVDVDVGVHDQVIRVAVGDNGVGGADPTGGSGLIGLKDRAAAIGGALRLESRPGEGTSLTAELPLRSGSH
jgi:PAS domain S-box-containing protein